MGVCDRKDNDPTQGPVPLWRCQTESTGADFVRDHAPLGRLGLLGYLTTEAPRPLGPRSDEKFGDLHGIEGGAFEELVADDPESEAVLQSAILAEAADGAIVLTGEVERHRVALEFRLIDDL